MSKENKSITLRNLAVGNAITCKNGNHRVKIKNIWIDDIHLSNPTIYIEYHWETLDGSRFGDESRTLKGFLQAITDQS